MMLSKKEIIEILSKDGKFVDDFILDAFIKNWKIDPIYEDENGVEFFDEVSFEKIKDLFFQRDKISKKTKKPCKRFENESSEDSTEEAVSEDSANFQHFEEAQQKHEVLPSMKPNVSLNNFNFEIKKEDFEKISQKIAKKISTQFESYLEESDFVERVMKSNTVKTDNKILSSKMKELIKENFELKNRLKSLEEDQNRFVRIFGNFYIKKQDERPVRRIF